MKTIEKFKLKNKHNMTVEFLNLGGAITAIFVPVEKKLRNVVLGYSDIEAYRYNDVYLGVAVGPIAGRVKNGILNIGEDSYKLSINTDRGHHLHGGKAGFSTAFWDVTSIADNTAVLKAQHPLGADGYPANMDIAMTYHLSDDNTFTITYDFSSDQDAYINPTNHTYFNLAGQGDVRDHYLTLKAKALALDDDFIPTKMYIDDSAFDFSEGKLIGKTLAAQHAQLTLARGIDHAFIFSDKRELTLNVDDLSLTIKTTTPAVVIYTGNYLNNEKHSFSNYQGICFESQDAPNSINLGLEHHITKPNKRHKTMTAYKFREIV